MNRDRLERAFRDVLAVDDDQPLESLHYGMPGWDSLAHLQLVAELEEVFDVALDPDQVVAMSDLRTAQDVLGQHGVGFDA